MARRSWGKAWHVKVGKVRTVAELTLLEHWVLCRVQVLECVGVGIAGAGRHAAHERGGIDLAARARGSHVHLLRHAAGRALLSLVVRHPGGHGMAGDAWVVLHTGGVARE